MSQLLQAAFAHSLLYLQDSGIDDDVMVMTEENDDLMEDDAVVLPGTRDIPVSPSPSVHYLRHILQPLRKPEGLYWCVQTSSKQHDPLFRGSKWSCQRLPDNQSTCYVAAHLQCVAWLC